MFFFGLFLKGSVYKCRRQRNLWAPNEPLSGPEREREQGGPLPNKPDLKTDSRARQSLTFSFP